MIGPEIFLQHEHLMSELRITRLRDRDGTFFLNIEGRLTSVDDPQNRLYRFPRRLENGTIFCYLADGTLVEWVFVSRTHLCFHDFTVCFVLDTGTLPRFDHVELGTWAENCAREFESYKSFQSILSVKRYPAS